MTIPHITKEQVETLFSPGPSAVDCTVRAFNARIDKANADADQSEYITAEQARALGGGNAWYLLGGVWVPCDGVHYSDEYKYRAIKQPKPAEPTTGCACKFIGDVNVSRCELHEAWHVAIYEWAERAKTAEAKPAAKKQISWADMPVGVLTNKGAIVRQVKEVLYTTCTYEPDELTWHASGLALAPASEQPWIAVQGVFEKVNGLIYDVKYTLNVLAPIGESISVFKITGIESGYELGGN